MVVTSITDDGDREWDVLLLHGSSINNEGGEERRRLLVRDSWKLKQTIVHESFAHFFKVNN